MSDWANGWMTYIFVTNSGATFVFIGLAIIILGMLTYAQFQKDEFDVRGWICNYVDGKMIPAPDKTILMGSWIFTSYLLFEHYTESAMTMYITLWIINGGAMILGKVASKFAERDQK